MNAARTLVVAAVAAAVLAGCGGGNGSSAPVRSGGTTGDVTTTLTPVGSATPAQLSASANIVRARLTAVGIVAHVNVSDGAVVVSAPAPARTAVATAALPGVLSFREFYQGYVAGPAIASAKPSADETFTGLGAPPNEPDQAAPSQVTQAALTSLDCATGGGRAPTIDEDPHHFVVACSSDGATKYLLAPADLTGAQVASATATQGQTSLGGQHAVWEVDLTFKDSAVPRVEAVTSRLDRKSVV